MLEDWTAHELLDEVDENGFELSPWEIGFVNGLIENRANWRGAGWQPTLAQRGKLIQIVRERCEVDEEE